MRSDGPTSSGETFRPFRFGFQSTTIDPAEVTGSAQEAETAGFDVFQVGDHIGTQLAPFVELAAAAAATSTIRLGTLVLNNDLRHPVVLAQEVATLDHQSGGRVELGLGAGHSFTEYAALGLSFDPPAVRKARLTEAVEILRALFDGDEVDYEGAHYRVVGARTLRPMQASLPLLVGVNGRAALEHAAAHADIVAPTMLGRTLEDGQHHEVRWEAERLDVTMEFIRATAGDRWPTLELHALVQAVVVTDDRAAAAEELGARLSTRPDDVLSTPFLCIGSHEEMARHLLACRARWGISYFTVRDIEGFAPVMELVRRLDASPE
ncbi:MAG TPA: TIGR03621 family F420-dependent LLM class oxidoreductase [Acidimicrobiales bacterium]|nr:TIGR03621 family F420-dependent LLM class oxidoreductase [Acidimicrobiales bacterium]